MATKILPPADALASAPAWSDIPSDGSGEFVLGQAQDEAAAALRETVIVPLTALGAIRASGADAESFLQNQLSNDLRELVPGRAQLSSYNSPKGRVLALFLLRRSGQDIILELRRDLLPATLKRLRMFVLRSKLVLEDAGAALPALGIAGPGAAEWLAAAGLPAPQEPWECADTGNAQVIRRPGTVPRFSVHAGTAQLGALWDARSARPVGSAAWRLLDIRAGLPAIRPETADQFVAQMLNLDRLGAVSFGKGCYPGQEIVARLHYLGNLKRRLFLGQCLEAEPVPGAEVFAAGAGQPVGSIVDSAPAEDGWANLAVLSLQLGTEADLHLGSPQGPKLTFDWTTAN